VDGMWFRIRATKLLDRMRLLWRQGSAVAEAVEKFVRVLESEADEERLRRAFQDAIREFKAAIRTS
jgi:hypothetical protein